jgi:dipeptidase E
MRILLGSGGYRTEERRQLLIAAIRRHFGPLRRVLFIPYALADHDKYLQLVFERGYDAGYELTGIHQHPDPVAAVLQAEAVFVGGGNTFRLLTELYRRQILEPLRDRVRQGMPYLGVSAGSNVACPTIMTTNDMPIVQPPSFAALELVPFQINPHYFSGNTFYKVGDALHEHFGETRDDRIREYHELNARPVIGLWEAGFLWIDGDTVTLTDTPARIFLPGKPPEDWAPGTVFSAAHVADGPRRS